MSDRVPLPSIAGLLTGFVAVDLFAGHFPAAQTLTAFQPAVTDPPSGGTVSVDLRTATGGGGSGLSAVIPDGGRFPATPVTGAISIAAGTTLYLRITAESGAALGFYGSYEVSAATGATAALTTLQRCKDFRGITGSTNDSMLNTLIQGVSTRMQSHMRRSIVSQTIVAEKHDARGDRDEITLEEFPVIAPPAVVMRFNGTVIDATTYEVDKPKGQVIQVTNGASTSWAEGRRAYEVDYDAGYATVPEDLAQAATEQVIHRFLQTREGGNRLSLRGEIIETGGDGQYMIGQWVPGVRETMDLYRNLRIV